MTTQSPDLTEQDVVFVQELVRNKDKDDAAIIAYRRAGYWEPAFPVVVAAERHLQRPEIQTALAKAMEQFKPQISGDRSRDSLLADTDKVFESALAAKDHAAAINAKRLQAQVMGWLQENVSVTHRLEITQLSDQQLEKIASKAIKVIDATAVDVTEPVRGIGQMGKTSEAVS